MPKYSLFLDTSSNYQIIGLIKEQNNQLSISCIKKPNRQMHSENTIVNLKKFLRENKINKKEINNIYVVNGPGSFVGIRVSLTIVKTWKILYPETKVYQTNSFAIHYQKGKSIYYLSANKYESYKGLFINQELAEVSLEKNLNHEVEYDKFELNNDWNNIVKQFQEIKNIEDLKPFYFKGAF